VCVNLGGGDAGVSHVRLKVSQGPHLCTQRAERVPEIMEAQRRVLLALVTEAGPLECAVEPAA
jgi:hypothetical protein